VCDLKYSYSKVIHNATVKHSIPTMHQILIPPQHFFIAAARFVLLIASSLFGILATYVLLTIMQRRIRAFRSPLRSVPGPKMAHWLRGNFVDVLEADSNRLQEEWVNTYGHVMKFYSAFWVRFHFFYMSIIYIDNLIVCRLPNSWSLIPWPFHMFFKIMTLSGSQNF
jgi:hypothetical protein